MATAFEGWRRKLMWNLLQNGISMPWRETKIAKIYWYLSAGWTKGGPT